MAKRAMAVVFVFLVTLTTTAQWASNDKPSGIPAYNAAPPPNGKKLPPILPVEQLWGDNAQSPYQTRAYDIAKKIPAVLHQQIGWIGTGDRRDIRDPSAGAADLRVGRGGGLPRGLGEERADPTARPDRTTGLGGVVPHRLVQ